MRRAVVVLVSCLLLAASTAAWAQAVTVRTPPDRFVAPGEFVTLVFRLGADAAVDARLAAATSSGWTVVSRIGDVSLEPARTTPVALTIEVPRDARAGLVERVNLTVAAGGVTTDHEVVLTVGERAALALDAPRDVTLSEEGVRVTVRNDGNASEHAALELRRGTVVIARRELELAAGERLEVVLALRGDGSHALVLTGERSPEVRRALSVVRFGAPEPDPLRLAGALSGAALSTGAWQGSLTLRGPLSDLATLDARLDAAAPRRSFAEVTLMHAGVRAGGGWRDPLRLGVPSGLGLAGHYRIGALALVGAIGQSGVGNGVVGTSESDASAGIVGGVGAEWSAATVRLAAGAGWSHSAPWLSARVGSDGGAMHWSVASTYRRNTITAAVTGELRDGDTTSRFELEARELLSNTALLAASAQVRDTRGTVYADARVPFASSDAWNGRFGVTQRVVSAVPGELRVALQAGNRESFARIGLQSAVGDAWRTTTGFGVRIDTGGLGLTVDTAWTNLGSDAFGADLRLAYYPASGEVTGRVAARYQLERDAFGVSLGGTWDIGERSVAASAAVGWHEGPWRIGVSGGAAYALDAAAPWSASVTLATRYAFELGVPDALGELAGGRDLGTIEGRVRADDGPLAHVELGVGRFRVRSDEAGGFSLRVPPGSYPVVVDVATVPIAYQLVEGTVTSVEVRRRETTTLTVEAVRTTVLRGWVLEDREGDGRADDPAVGVRARLLVTDAQGLRRNVVTDEAGAFVLRGMLAGAVAVALVDVPAGATVVGDGVRTVRLEPGVAGEVAFLVRPAEVRVQAFTAQALRVRSVALEVDRVPPGTAPLLRVEVQGEPDGVTLSTADGAEQRLVHDGAAWLGRLDVPLEQRAGVLAFTVAARSGDEETTRRAQLIVDPAAAAVLVSSDAPVRAGAALTVRLSAYLDARTVTLAQPFGEDVAMVEDDPGRWHGVLPVPAGTPDAVYELAVRVEAADGRTLIETLRFRVLDP